MGAMIMLFYDFEVFKYDWMVVINDTDTKDSVVIINDRQKLIDFHAKNINNIWIGYNSRNYDQWVLKAIVCGFEPQEMNSWIIEKGRHGYQFSKQLQDIKLINYDTQIRLDRSLKQLEGFMGCDIQESSVPFDIQRKLTQDEINETVRYCRHDVEQTMLVFAHLVSEFNAHIGLVSEFNLPLKDINKTKANLVAKILGSTKIPHRDEFRVTLVDTIKLDKYDFVRKWYQDTIDEVSSNPELEDRLISDVEFKKEWYKAHKLTVDVMGIKHVFGWGGLHGARKKYVSKGLLINSDVGSFYPSLMIQYNFLSRNVVDAMRYPEIYNYRMSLKKAGKKKEQQPYKIVLNTTYGASKAEFNALYDPLQANNVCLNGQLMLLDLIEKVEVQIPDALLVQSNTDGVMFEFKQKSDLDTYQLIQEEWCNRTRMTLDHDTIDLVIQKDVNNYCIIIDKNGKKDVKSKGAWLKERSIVDNDTPILQKGLIDYFMKGITPEETVNNCKDLMQFQQICKVSRDYRCAVYAYDVGTKTKKVLKDKEYFNERVFRVFASKSRLDKQLFKVKHDGSIAKFAGTSNRVFIDNSDVRGKAIPKRLDKQFYIDTIWERIKCFNC